MGFSHRIYSMVQSPRKRFEYEKARFMREKGKSYNDIKKELCLSKSTISLWCRDVKLTSQQKAALLHSSKRMIAQQLGARANHEKREKEIAFVRNTAKREIVNLTTGAFKVAGAMLYWAEGTKTQSAAVSNSDPRIIKFMVRWFDKFFQVTPEQFTAHLHIHYGNDENKIKKFWSTLTGIPLKNFGKSFIKPRGTGHRTNILPNGIIKIRVKGVGTENLRHRIIAWSEKVYEIGINNIRP